MEYGPLTRVEAIAMYRYTSDMLDLAAHGRRGHRPLTWAEAEAMWEREVAREQTELAGRQLADA